MINQYDVEANQQKLVSLLKNHQNSVMNHPTLDKNLLSLAYLDEVEGYLGGVFAKQIGNRMHISLLAVEESVRGRKIGSQLLIQVEVYARKQKCHYLTVNTQDFQAVSFYQKHQFSIFGQLEDCPFEGTTKFYLKKRLE